MGIACIDHNETPVSFNPFMHLQFLIELTVLPDALLGKKLFDRTSLIVAEFSQSGIKRAVVLDGVTVGIEQGGVKVSEGAVTGLPIVGQAYVLAAQVDAGVVTGQNNEGILGSMGVVGFATVGKIENHGVVEHCSSGFRYALETGYDSINESHVVGTGQFTDGLRLEAADHFVVSNVMHIHLFTFDSG